MCFEGIVISTDENDAHLTALINLAALLLSLSYFLSLSAIHVWRPMRLKKGIYVSKLWMYSYRMT